MVDLRQFRREMRRLAGASVEEAQAMGARVRAELQRIEAEVLEQAREAEARALRCGCCGGEGAEPHPCPMAQAKGDTEHRCRCCPRGAAICAEVAPLVPRLQG